MTVGVHLNFERCRTTRYLAIRPTGNCNPALADRLTAFFPAVLPFPRPDILAHKSDSREIGGIDQHLLDTSARLVLSYGTHSMLGFAEGSF